MYSRSRQILHHNQCLLPSKKVPSTSTRPEIFEVAQCPDPGAGPCGRARVTLNGLGPLISSLSLYFVGSWKNPKNRRLAADGLSSDRLSAFALTYVLHVNYIRALRRLRGFRIIFFVVFDTYRLWNCTEFRSKSSEFDKRNYFSTILIDVLKRLIKWISVKKPFKIKFNYYSTQKIIWDALLYKLLNYIKNLPDCWKIESFVNSFHASISPLLITVVIIEKVSEYCILSTFRSGKSHHIPEYLCRVLDKKSTSIAQFKIFRRTLEKKLFEKTGHRSHANLVCSSETYITFKLCCSLKFGVKINFQKNKKIHNKPGRKAPGIQHPNFDNSVHLSVFSHSSFQS